MFKRVGGLRGHVLVTIQHIPAIINMGKGLLLKDVHSKEKGVFGDLSSLSDFSELSQSAQ